MRLEEMNFTFSRSKKTVFYSLVVFVCKILFYKSKLKFLSLRLRLDSLCKYTRQL